MKDFKDKVAVITGAASGIGRGLADKCCDNGMKVVLADVEAEALWQTERELRAAGATVTAVQTDVSRLDEIETLAQQTLSTFEGVHLLFNNAGVGAGGTIWESTHADWEWVMGVNLWGVIHGLRVFVPLMLEQGTQCHIVNTASLAGLLPRHAGATYGITKHAVVALSEQLYYELAEREANIKVSVFCPGWVKTRILESARNRPTALDHVDDPAQIVSNTATEAIAEAFRPWVEEGMSPQQAADVVFAAIADERFYILTDVKRVMLVVKTRLEDIVHGRNPTFAM